MKLLLTVCLVALYFDETENVNVNPGDLVFLHSAHKPSTGVMHKKTKSRFYIYILRFVKIKQHCHYNFGFSDLDSASK